MSGRIAALIAVFGACASIPQDQEDTAQPIAGRRVRIVAANLTSGSGTYNDGPGMRILAGLKPDIALVQEMLFGRNTAADLRTFVDAVCGPECEIARGTQAGIPNAVVSRFPILESGDITDPEVGNRAFTFARIDLPGPTDLWAFSLHLLTSSATRRRIEAEALAEAIAQRVPDGDFLVIGGDFNTRSRGEAAIAALAPVVVTNAPQPVDQSGDGDTNESRSRPFDWVLPDDDLAAHATTTVIGANAFARGLVVDTRRYQPLADLAPAQSGDSHVFGMQHMAVVRDFDIPDDGGGGGGGGGTADVHLDEVLANEPGSAATGEFVELLNRGTGAADLAGWTIADAVGVRHVFAPGTTLAAGARLVVFGSAAGIPPGVTAIGSSTGALGLSNGGDTVTLADPAGTAIDTVPYTSSLSGVDGVSMNRTPAGSTGPFVLHTTLSTRSSSPGTAP